METLEAFLRRKLSLEDAQRIIFAPDAEDMADFALVMQRSAPGCPPTHPHAKLQPLFFATFYIIHRHDERLLRSFIVQHGGLRALASMLASENVYLASQALESLHAITAAFDWHADPPVDPKLLACMADLAQADVAFVKNLGLCYQNRFPGCSSMALSVLAFWLGLLRYFFCKDRILRLGADVLELLRRWSERLDVDEDERKLARALLDDFSRFPLDAASIADGASELSAEGHANISHVIAHKGEPERGVAAVPRSEPEDSERCREGSRQPILEGSEPATLPPTGNDGSYSILDP